MSSSTAHNVQVNFNHPHQVEAMFDVHTKTEWFSAIGQKPGQFRPPAQKLSQSITTLETSHHRPAHKNQVNFDPYAENQANFDPYIIKNYFSARNQNWSRFWLPHRKHVNFDPDAETK